MADEQERRSTFARIAAVMAEVGDVAADAENPQDHYKYASADAVYAKVRPVLGRHGLSVVCRQTAFDVQSVGKTNRGSAINMLTVSFDFAFAGPGDGPDTLLWEPTTWQHRFFGTDTIKAIGAARTYARRYWLTGALLIATPDVQDVDGQRVDADDRASADALPAATATAKQRLWAVCKAKGVDADAARGLIRDVAGVTPHAKVTDEQWAAILKLADALPDETAASGAGGS